jgi:hypothetical protein
LRVFGKALVLDHLLDRPLDPPKGSELQPRWWGEATDREAVVSE